MYTNNEGDEDSANQDSIVFFLFPKQKITLYDTKPKK